MGKTKKAILLWLLASVSVFSVAGCNNAGETPADQEPLGAFYTLQEAYESEYLTKTDLETIAHYLNEEIAYPEALDSKIENDIKETAAYHIRNRKTEPFTEATAEGVTIISFYGKYSDSYVTRIRNNYDLHPADVPSRWEEIGGVQFHFIGYDRITVWRGKE